MAPTDATISSIPPAVNPLLCPLPSVLSRVAPYPQITSPTVSLLLAECTGWNIKASTATFVFPDLPTAATFASSTQDVLLSRGVFGGVLSEIVRRSPYCIPLVLHDCCKYLVKHGLQEEGLFRVPGNQEYIRRIKKAYDASLPSASQLMTDPHSVAGVLKLFFRELADTVIPMSHYSLFTSLNCKSAQGKDQKVTRIASLIRDLPLDNQQVLNQTIHLLKLVSQYAQINKMLPKNCAMVLAPGLFRNPARADDHVNGGMASGGPRGSAIGAGIGRSSGIATSPLSPLTVGGLGLGGSDQTAFADELLEQEAVIQLMIEHYPVLFPLGPPFLFTSS